MLTHHQTSMVQRLKFENGYVTSSHTLQGMLVLIHPGLKLINICKRGLSSVVLIIIAKYSLLNLTDNLLYILHEMALISYFDLDHDHDRVYGIWPHDILPMTKCYLWHKITLIYFSIHIRMYIYICMNINIYFYIQINLVSSSLYRSYYVLVIIPSI